MKKLLFLLLMISIELAAQNTLLNEAKYWVWRDRLVNDFMVPNYTSTPASEENHSNSLTKNSLRI